MKALLLIDFQNDFCPGGALAVPEGDEAVAVANKLIPLFDTVILTQDWHPAGHHSFASSYEDKEPYSTTELSYGTDRKSTRLNSSHVAISYAVFCLKKKNNKNQTQH